MDKIKSIWNYVKGQVVAAPIPFGIGVALGFFINSLF